MSSRANSSHHWNSVTGTARCVIESGVYVSVPIDDSLELPRQIWTPVFREGASRRSNDPKQGVLAAAFVSVDFRDARG